MTERVDIMIPEELTAPLLRCASSTELSVEDIVEIALKFYLHRRKENG